MTVRGTFTITEPSCGKTTVTLDYDAPAEVVQMTLEAFAVNATVERTESGYLVDFSGANKEQRTMAHLSTANKRIMAHDKHPHHWTSLPARPNRAQRRAAEGQRVKPQNSKPRKSGR